MRKIMSLALCGALTVSLSGCVLAPQVISLSEKTHVEGHAQTAREALVRVLDERPITGQHLGTRGGREPSYSPLLADRALADVLTARLQNSMAQLGFGADSMSVGVGSPMSEPLKVQMAVRKFNYSCNEGVIVSECGIEMQFMMTIIDGPVTFNKPYGIKEVRSLAAAPVPEYNKKWVDETLDKVWQYMFNDPELKQALGLGSNLAW